MSQARDQSANQSDITRQLASHASGMSYNSLSKKARTVGKHAILDWLGVSLAGGQVDVRREMERICTRTTRASQQRP